MKKLYKIDNAGLIFPAVSSETHSSVFRLAAVLHQAVKPDVLQSAVDLVMPRFPALFVRIRKGSFWNYFEQNSKALFVQQETAYPCAPINPEENNGYMLKVLYHRNRISVEVFHALTDGLGGMEFLKTLLYQYFLLQGIHIDAQGCILLPDEDVPTSEIEDSFLNYAQQPKLAMQTDKEGYEIKGARLVPYGNHVIHGRMRIAELKQAAKRYQVTITAYLAARLAYAIYDSYMRYGIFEKPIVVCIPVNLRKTFPSKTLRNFFAMINVCVPAVENLTFETVVASCEAQIKQKASKEELKKSIFSNVKLETMKASRFTPLFLKNKIINFGFMNFGENQKTIALSNLGSVHLPEDMRDLIYCFEALLYPTPHSHANCGVISFGEDLVVTFTSDIQEREFIKKFFQALAREDGVAVAVYSNGWDETDEM